MNLTLAEVQGMRDSVTATFYTETADIYQQPTASSARNASGFVDRTFSGWTKLNTAPELCCVEEHQGSAEERLAASQVQAITHFDISFRPQVQLNERCRIKILTSSFNPGLVGNVYDVTGNPDSSVESHTVAACVLVKPTAVNP